MQKEIQDIFSVPLSYIKYRHEELIDGYYRESPNEICKRVSIINKLEKQINKANINPHDDYVIIKKSDWDLFQYE